MESARVDQGVGDTCGVVRCDGPIPLQPSSVNTALCTQKNQQAAHSIVPNVSSMQRIQTIVLVLRDLVVCTVDLERSILDPIGIPPKNTGELSAPHS